MPWVCPEPLELSPGCAMSAPPPMTTRGSRWTCPKKSTRARNKIRQCRSAGWFQPDPSEPVLDAEPGRHRRPGSAL